MKVSVSYPPIDSVKGTPLISQNRFFTYRRLEGITGTFSTPTYVYPIVPAYAATLLKNEGHQVIWDDAVAKEKTYATWIKDVERNDPDLIMFESKTPVIRRHWRIIDDLKSRCPEAKVVLVGDHVTALPEESLINSKADFVLTGGDYDFTLLRLVKYLEGEAKEMEAGIYFRENGFLRNTGRFRSDHFLDSLPQIDRELTGWRLYAFEDGNYKRVPGTYTMVARDCWWNVDGGCSFCSWKGVLYPNYRTRSPRLVVEEIAALTEKYGIREVFDDSGTFPVGKWLEEFCDMMIAEKLNEKVYTDINMRPGVLNQEQYSLMKKAGFRMVLFGLESANDFTLTKLNKGVTVNETIKSIKLADLAGLEPHATLMFGYPWETREDALRTLKLGKLLLQSGWAHTLQATLIVPYPGTRLFEEAKEKGWLKTLDWDHYDMDKSVMSCPLTESELKDMRKEIYRMYFSPSYALRRLIRIRSVDDIEFLVRGLRKLLAYV